MTTNNTNQLSINLNQFYDKGLIGESIFEFFFGAMEKNIYLNELSNLIKSS
jgi:hypothetical protein